MPAMQFPPFVWPLVVAAVISAVNAVVMWQRRPGAGIVPAVTLVVGAAGWSSVAALKLINTGLDAKLLFGSLSYVGITAVVASWMVFVLAFTGRSRWLTRRNLALLMIEPVIVVLLVFTNEYHHLIWSELTLVEAGGYILLDTSHGAGFWVHAVYSYILLLVGTVLLVRSFTHSRHLYQGQVVTLLIAAVVPWIGNFLYLTGLNPVPALDLTPLAFTITGLAISWSLLRFRLMDIAPIARDLVIENMNDALMVIDAHNRIVDINPAFRAMFSLGDESVVGQPVESVLTRQKGVVDQYIDVTQVRAEMTVGEGESRRYLEMQISPMRNRKQALIGRLVVLRDVTKRREAAEKIRTQNEELLRANVQLEHANKEAEAANRLKSEFLATMSHELRTPLNAIIGYSDLILGGMTGELTERQQDYVERVLRNGERLLALINDILDISKIEAGRFELSQYPYQPEELLTGVTTKMQSLLYGKDLTLETYLDPRLPDTLQGDPERLEQILVNLISNAIKFTDSGTINVRFERGGEAEWQIVVKDTGIGIPPHALEYIFDEFRQVDGSVRRKHGGTGLGLAIVRKLVLLMGGTVHVDSEVEKGSTFTVMLPLTMPEKVAVN